jgi:DNA-binding transcriptional regulator YiaG
MYHYAESGLRNVYLKNGYYVRKTPYGEGVAIEDVLGLHREIARLLIKKPGRLTGAEFRFLRKELELSQKKLGSYIGKDAQAVARWENGKTRVPKTTDHFLRAIFREVVEGNAQIIALVDRLNEMDALERQRIEFVRKAEHWEQEAA